jgi:transcriptional regulator with XRE-family HTH domain
MDDLVKIQTLFGKRIRELRIAQQLSQEELAAICNLDRTYISSIERGRRNVSLRNIAVLATSLGVSVSLLMEGIALDE